MKKYRIILAVAALAAALASCRKEEQMQADTFKIDPAYLQPVNFTQDAQYQFIPVQSNIDASSWRFSSTQPWCIIGPSVTGKKGIMISVQANEEPEQRPAKVSVTALGNTYSFDVVQLGYGPAILVSNVYVAPGGGQTPLRITSNIEYSVSAPQLDQEDEQDWIVQDLTTKSLAQNTIYYNVLPNFAAGPREAVIKIEAKESQYSAKNTKCVITQACVPETATDSVIGGSEGISVVSAVAVSGDNDKYYSWDAAESVNWPGAGGPEFMIDGSDETYYCSPRGLDKEGDRGTEFPYDMIFTLEGAEVVDYMTITPWDGTGNQIKEFNFFYMPAGSDKWVQMNQQDVPVVCPVSDKAFTYMFDESLENPKAIRLEVLGTYYNLVKIKEVGFFKTNRKETHDWILKVFTDLSCSQLREGITKQDINSMAEVTPYIAKNVAMPLYLGTYKEAEKEYRMHTYEAYSSPDACKKAFNIRLYSELDSPTGILGQDGETYIVCVDKVPEGHSVRFIIHGDGGEEFNYGTPLFSQGLKAGVNVVNVNIGSTVKKGMIFIVHTDHNLTPASEPVKVHIVPIAGEVAGYFDLSRHTDQDYSAMLEGYKYPYFFMKGEHVVMAAHTGTLKDYASSSYASGLAQLDKIMIWEKELMGLGQDRHPEFNNHILAISTTADIALDASDRRIRFTHKNLAHYYSEEQIKEDTPWGVAHEIGHVNQPAICWESTIESSNNLFSNYAMYKCGIQESRGRSLTLLGENCGKPWYLLGDAGQYKGEDAELHMRMNWQLWNYFVRCGADPQFWTKAFDILREKPTPGMYYWMYNYKREDPGTCQLMFYEACCNAAQMDLTEFFETWGFFVPVDVTYGQYQSGIAYKVSADMIKEYKDRVAACKYPKAPAIQYLEDRTALRASYNSADKTFEREIKMGHYTLFQDRTELKTIPTYTLNSYSRTVTVSDCSQAAAVEVRDGDFNLLYFSNLGNFTIPERTGTDKTIKLDEVQLYAVQWDGARKLMTRK